MFDLELADPPVSRVGPNKKFRVTGEIKILSRCWYLGPVEETEKDAVELEREIVIATLKHLERLPFQGRIGIMVHRGVVFLSGKIEAWNQQAENQIDKTLMELEKRLNDFALLHPSFRQVIALSYFPTVLLDYPSRA